MKKEEQITQETVEDLEVVDQKTINDGISSLTNNLANSRSAINTTVITSRRLTLPQLQEINKTGLFLRILALKTDSVMKNGWVFKDKDKSEEFYNKHKAEIKKAVRAMFGYGRGLLVIISKNETTDTPLNKSSLSNYRVKAYTGDMVTATTVDFDVSSERFQKPETYLVRDKTYHHSRVIDFTYVDPPELLSAEYQFGGISEAEQIYPQLIADGIIERAAPTMLDKSATVVYGIKDFRTGVTGDQEKSMLKYIAATEDLRSIYGATVIDSEDTISTVTQNLANLNDTNDISLQRMSLVSAIPKSIFLGEGTSGFGTSAAVEKNIWNETVEGYQEQYVIPRITEFMDIFELSAPEIKPDQNITALERTEFQSKILDNATKMNNLGIQLNISKYLSDNGFDIDENADVEPVKTDNNEAKPIKQGLI